MIVIDTGLFIGVWQQPGRVVGQELDFEVLSLESVSFYFDVLASILNFAGVLPVAFLNAAEKLLTSE